VSENCAQQYVCAIVGVQCVIRSLYFKIRSVTVDDDGAGRQNHSLRSFILAPIPTTSHTRTLAASFLGQ
jgi:hypothetical protein